MLSSLPQRSCGLREPETTLLRWPLFCARPGGTLCWPLFSALLIALVYSYLNFLSTDMVRVHLVRPRRPVLLGMDRDQDIDGTLPCEANAEPETDTCH